MKDGALMMMMTDVAGEHEAAFNRWYNEIHIPELMTLPGFISAERFRQVGEGMRYLALYRLRDVDVVESDTFKTWRANSESTQLWVSRFVGMKRHLYEKIFSSDAGE
jgi:antibiotic biosynthesis monooxygenase (ABM) superfamily enzyme